MLIFLQPPQFVNVEKNLVRGRSKFWFTFRQCLYAFLRFNSVRKVKFKTFGFTLYPMKRT